MALLRVQASLPLEILYPSSIAVTQRPRGMTEYAMAKAAGESLRRPGSNLPKPDNHGIQVAACRNRANCNSAARVGSRSGRDHASAAETAAARCGDRCGREFQNCCEPQPIVASGRELTVVKLTDPWFL